MTRYSAILTGAAFAFCTAGSLLVAGSALAADPAGIAAGVQGDVRIVPVGGAERPLKSGEDIRTGDRVRSGANGSIQILLLDETAFTIGPNSDMVIDAFANRSGAEPGKVEASVERGSFRFVTGKVAQANPENMQVRTPRAILGVRGTIVSGTVDAQETMVTLGGPGEFNNAGERFGALQVEGGAGVVNLRRPGFVAIIGPSGQPEVRSMTTEFRGRLFGMAAGNPGGVRIDSLAAGAAQSGNAAPAGGAPAPGAPLPSTTRGIQLANAVLENGPSNVAGQNMAGAGPSAAAIAGFFNGAAPITEVTGTANDDIAEATQRRIVAENAARNDPSSFADLLGVTLATGTYTSTGVALTNKAGTGGTGSYDIATLVVFGARTATTTVSNLTIAGGGNNVNNGGFVIATNYAALNGPASITATNLCGGGSTSSCTTTTAFRTVGGDVARQMQHQLSVSSGGGANVSAGGGTAERAP